MPTGVSWLRVLYYTVYYTVTANRDDAVTSDELRAQRHGLDFFNAFRFRNAIDRLSDRIVRTTDPTLLRMLARIFSFCVVESSFIQ
jgi:hypothetical protein